MDKRFVTFLMLTMLLFVGYLQLRLWLNPPVVPDEVAERENAEIEEGNDGEEQPPVDGGQPGDGEVDPPETDETEPATAPEMTPVIEKRAAPARRATLGSLDPDGTYRMLLTFNSRGAALERAELNSPQYRDLEDTHGYLGHLALSEGARGAIVNAVGDGTPAAQAKCTKGSRKGGLQAGDEILQIDSDTLVASEDRNYVRHFYDIMNLTRPGQELTVQVRPKSDEDQPAAKTLTYTVKLIRPPMQVISPEQFDIDDPESPLQPLSFLTTLSRLAGSSLGEPKRSYERGELEGLPSLFNNHWELLDSPSKDEVAFRYLLSKDDVKEIASGQPLEIIKRFRLAQRDEANAAGDDAPAYHLTMHLEVRNLGDEETKIALQQMGPTGLPLEGWWYVRKGSPDFGGAGMRDIVWRSAEGPNVLHRLPVIFDAEEDGERVPLFTRDAEQGNPQLRYVGVDGPYFSAVMMPDTDAPSFTPDKFRFDYAEALVTSEFDKKRKATSGVSFRLLTSPQSLNPGDSYQQQYKIFIGPKDTPILTAYGLQDTIVYGWQFFGFIARLLLHVLHAIYYVVQNYGIAIILLTVLVRLAVMPIGRKQAQNAARMQELAPELKAIADKHKDNMEARTKATQELWKKHNFHPLGGCWMMFLQLPIFIGLYKALSVSIDLRQASLIPGLSWCSNLAGPDMFLYWEPYLPAFLASESGYLGPYLNILPLVTIGLFIMQQKLFTPPATDEQQEMQQKMMKYMMVFMGFLFFKVPSGLCLYFIVSALWSIGERKLLPKPKTPAGKTPPPEKDAQPTPPPKPKTKAQTNENSLVSMFNRWLEKPDANGRDEGKNGDAKRRAKRKKKRK